MCLYKTLDPSPIRTLTIIFQKNTISQETTSFQKCHICTCVVEFQINKLTEVTLMRADFGPCLPYAPRIQNSPGARFSKVPKLFGRISGEIILFVSSKRRRIEARNFAAVSYTHLTLPTKA